MRAIRWQQVIQNMFLHGVFIMSKIMNENDNNENGGKSEKGLMKTFFGEIKLYFRMLSDVFTCKYTKMPMGSLVAGLGSLLYVISPVDLIPDFIPVLGILEDIVVLGLCMKFARYDVQEYKRTMKII